MLKNAMVIDKELVEMWIKLQKRTTTSSETEKCWKLNLSCFGNIILEGSSRAWGSAQGSSSSEMRQHRSGKWMDKKGPDCRLGAGNAVMQTHEMLFQTGREGTKRSFSREWQQLPRVEAFRIPGMSKQPWEGSSTSWHHPCDTAAWSRPWGFLEPRRNPRVVWVGRSPKGRARSGRARQGAGLPANHVPVPVHGDVGALSAVVGPKVTIWGPKPLIKAVPQGVELGPVPQVPGNKSNRSEVRFYQTSAHQCSMQEHSLCLRNQNSKHFDHINDSRAMSWALSHLLQAQPCRLTPVLTYIPFYLLSNHSFPFFPSTGVFSHAVWWSALLDYTAPNHCRDAHNVLLKDSDLWQVLLSHWAVKTQGRAHEMHRSILIPFMEHSCCQNGTERPEWKWNEVFVCTCGHKTHLAAAADSSSLPCSLKILHP